MASSLTGHAYLPGDLRTSHSAGSSGARAPARQQTLSDVLRAAEVAAIVTVPGGRSWGQPVEAPGFRLQWEDFDAAQAGLLGVTAQCGGAHHSPGGRCAGITHGSGQARNHTPAVVVALQVGGTGAELVRDQLISYHDRGSLLSSPSQVRSAPWPAT